MSRRDAALELLGIERWQLRGTRASAPASRAEAEVSAPAVAESPRQRVSRVARIAPEPAPGVAPAGPVPSTPAGDSWERLVADVAGCTACGLHATRTQTVFGVGDRRAEWLVIGEAPGADEDRKGEPFVGRAGQLLDQMLLAVGLPRERVFIANVLKSRPPNNRDPRPDEVAACLPFLMRQIALLCPRIILVVGRIAAQNLLGTEETIGKLRGRLHHFGPDRIPMVVTYHPAYLLRSPVEKRKAWEDLKLARRIYRELPPRPAEA